VTAEELQRVQLEQQLNQQDHQHVQHEQPLQDHDHQIPEVLRTLPQDHRRGHRRHVLVVDQQDPEVVEDEIN
jgi:hypothetical protein